MRLPEDFVIYDIKYTGEKNRDEMPHGEGVMEYFVACIGCRNHFKYEGTFKKGMRGIWRALFNVLDKKPRRGVAMVYGGRI